MHATIDGISIIASYYFAWFLRIFLPFGENFHENFVFPSIILSILVLISIIWWYLKAKHSSTLISEIDWIVFPFLIILIAYFSFGNVTGLGSKLFYVYWFMTQILLFYGSRRIFRIENLSSFSLQTGIMKSTRIWFSYLKNIMFQFPIEIIFSIVGALIVAILLSKSGLGLLPDSQSYMDTAFNLALKNNLEYNPLWPPFYSIVIYIFMIFTPFPAVAANFISIFAFAGSLFVFTLLLCKISKNTLINLLLIFLFASFRPIFEIYQYALSENLFSLWSIIAFLYLYKFMEFSNDRDVILAALFIGLAAVTRYVGISLIGSLIIIVFYIHKRNLPSRKRKSLAIFSIAISALPISIVFISNLLRYQTMVGSNRLFNKFDISKVFAQIGAILSHDLSIYYQSFFLLMALSYLLFIVKKIDTKSRRFYTLLVIYFFPYLTFLILSASTSPVDLGTRFFSSFYFLLFFSIAVFWNDVQSLAFRSKAYKFLYKTIIPFTLIVLVYFQIYNQIERFGDLFERINLTRGNFIEHYHKGFSGSASASLLGEFLFFTMADQDRISVSLLLGEENHFASSFLYSDAIFQNRKYDNFVFLENEITAYELLFMIDNDPKSIQYIPVSNLHNFVEIITHPEFYSTNHFIIIVSDAWLFENNLDKEQLEKIFENFQFKEDVLSPYTVFSFYSN